MKSNFLFKLFTLAFMFVMFSLQSFAEENYVNSLSQIVVDKPFDNNYQLSLYFNEQFRGNAFLQKRANGSFYVYIPDTVTASENIKTLYKKKVKKSDVKISIEEQPYIKENSQSKYLRLSVETPINSDIQLVAQKINPQESSVGGNSFMNIYTLIVSVLIAIFAILATGIYKAMKRVSTNQKNYTAFPSSFLNSNKEYTRKTAGKLTYEQHDKIDLDSSSISPISGNDFSCFDLPEKNEEVYPPISSTIKANTETQSIEQRTIQAKVTSPIKKEISVDLEEELDLPTAENIIVSKPVQKETKDEEDDYRPELVSELKIGNNRGFYLTTVGENDFALFGYVGEKIFFLQKFSDLTQINLQARFYDNKDGEDLYIVRLDSYKAMLAVSDTEIKELAVI